MSAPPKDREQLRKELQESLGQAHWAWLAPHVERDALVVVSPELDLLEVGIEVALDNSQVVSKWIEQKSVYKPTQHQLDHWNESPDTQFKSLVVQPYVLIQLSAH